MQRFEQAVARALKANQRIGWHRITEAQCASISFLRLVLGTSPPSLSVRLDRNEIESGSVLGLGGRDFIVESGQFTLITHHDDDGETEHRVMLEASAEALEGYPVYSDDWWDRARERSREAWLQTQEGAESAWQTTQEGAERAWDTTRENAQRAWEAARDAVGADD